MKRQAGPSEFSDRPKRSRGLESFDDILFALRNVDLNTDQLAFLSNEIDDLYSLKANQITQNFPSDLWQKIIKEAGLQKLHVMDLLPFRAVNQSWNKVICSFPKVDTLHLIDVTPISKIFPFLRSLRLTKHTSKPDFALLTGLTKLKLEDGKNISKMQKSGEYARETLYSDNLKELQGLTNLQHLQIKSRYVISLSPLTTLTKLNCLYLKTPSFIERTKIDEIQNLTKLIAQDRQIFGNGKGLFIDPHEPMIYEGGFFGGRFHGQGRLLHESMEFPFLSLPAPMYT
jgi:hypothetical protein